MSTLYVSDLDGTLLRNDGTLSTVSRMALQRLLADRLVFSVASARSVVSMRPLLEGLRLTLPVIEFNGAFVSDLETGRHEVVNALDGEIARDLFALIVRFGHSPFVSTFDGDADCLYYGAATNAGERHYVSGRLGNRDPRLRYADDRAVSLRDQVVCLTVIGKVAPLRELEIAIREQNGKHVEIHLFENRYSPGWFWLTIHDRRATKDQAIRLLMESRGLGKHELVVFGDHMNDIKMLQMASQAVAVANAHPEVRRHATHVIGTNQEDSVVKFIRDHHAGMRRAST